jgi:hypothetical protein
VVVVVVVVHEVSKQWEMRGINSKEEKEQQYRGRVVVEWLVSQQVNLKRTS